MKNYFDDRLLHGSSNKQLEVKEEFLSVTEWESSIEGICWVANMASLIWVYYIIMLLSLPRFIFVSNGEFEMSLENNKNNFLFLFTLILFKVLSIWL